MPIPTHQESCTTRCWQTTCPDCGKPVYFLCCTCGSKVFFDFKGYPWPLHKDSCPGYLVRQMINNGTPARNIRLLLDAYSRETGVRIPVAVDRLLTQYGAGGALIIVNIPPDPIPILIQGIVKRINAINLFHRLRIDSNPINRALMGEFALRSYYEVTVQELQQEGVRAVKSWNFLIPCEEVDGCGFRVDLFMQADLQAHVVYDDDYVFWVATSIDWDDPS